MDDYFGGLAREVGTLARDALGSGALVVSVKTNLGPEIPVSGGEGSGLLDALGIRAAVIVRDRSGRRIAGYGEPPATDPIKAALVFGLAGLIGFALLRGVFKR